MASFFTRLLENAAAAGLVVLSGVNNVIHTTSPGMEWIKIGTTQVVAEDLINYMNGQGSLVLNLDYFTLFDRIFFASGFVYGLSKVGATQRLIRALDGLTPLPPTFNDALVNGSLILLNREVTDLLDANATINSTPLRYLLHPSYLVRQM